MREYAYQELSALRLGCSLGGVLVGIQDLTLQVVFTVFSGVNIAKMDVAKLWWALKENSVSGGKAPALLEKKKKKKIPGCILCSTAANHQGTASPH